MMKEPEHHLELLPKTPMQISTILEKSVSHLESRAYPQAAVFTLEKEIVTDVLVRFRNPVPGG